jgi:Autographiviridae RNA polymerase
MDARVSSERRTEEKFERQEFSRSKRGYGATAECMALCQELAPQLADVIRKRLKARTELNCLLRRLGPDVLALAALTSALESITMGRGEPETTIALGRIVQGELWAAGQPRKTRTRILKSADPAKTARKIGYRLKDWPRAYVAKVGGFLKDALLEGLPDVFVAVGRSYELHITKGAEDRAMSLRERVMWRNPSFVPCTEPPKPWIAWQDGGYWDERTRISATFVRNCHHPEQVNAVKVAFRDGTIQPHVDGVNALQAVPWTINLPVLEALKRNLPSFERRCEWRRAGKKRMKSNVLVRVGRKWVSENLLAEDIKTAEGLVGKTFYTPLNVDKRGRVYAVCNFNYGREDHVRGLFLFAHGWPIPNPLREAPGLAGWLAGYTHRQMLGTQ